MASSADALHKLQDYVRRSKDTDNAIPSPGNNSVHAAQLEAAFEELSLQIDIERKALEQVANDVLASG